MKRALGGIVLLFFVAATAAGAAGQGGDETGFVVRDLELVSLMSRADWVGDWTGPVEAATILAWFHDHGFPGLLPDLTGDGVVDQEDTIELADRLGKGEMKTAEAGRTPDYRLVYGLAAYVAGKYPALFELKIYDAGFPAEYAPLGTLAPDAIPGILLTLMPEPSIAAYETELLSAEGVIVGIEEAEGQNYYLTGRSFLYDKTPEGYVPVDLAWGEEDRWEPGYQGQVLETEARETDALYLLYQGAWRKVEFMAALSPVVQKTQGEVQGGCAPGAIAYDVTTTATEFGVVRIAECVTRDGDVDTYTYTVTNVSFLFNGCGICAFGIPNILGLATLGQSGPPGWFVNPTMPAGWEWRAPLGDCGIEVGHSASFSFSVPGPTEDCKAKGFVCVCPVKVVGTAMVMEIPCLGVETTGPCRVPQDGGCPDLVVAIDRASCTCAWVGNFYRCTLSVRVTVGNVGGEDSSWFWTRLSSSVGTDEWLRAGLAAGASSSHTFTLTFNCLNPRDCPCPTFTVTVDSHSNVDECSEKNNSAKGETCCK